MNLGLSGRVALITGGSHGIGLATALELASEGCDLAICSRTMERLQHAQALIEAKGVKVLAMQADVQDPTSADRVVDQVIDRFGTVDILVNNVGGGGRWGKESVEDTDLRVWEEVMDKNYFSAVRFTRLVIPYMRARKWGRVVTVSSKHGRESGGRAWYTAAKSAEIALMKTLARKPDFARDNLTFNTVAPGNIMIPDTGWEQAFKDDPVGMTAYVERECPRGSLGKPEEVAAVIAFLCSMRASLLSGACIAVDGGESMAF